MSTFLADLHIHSRFSRATSKRLNAAHLAAWGMVKGLSVLGTGDFTHPLWRAELRDHLTEDQDTGLYTLKTPLVLHDELPEYVRPNDAPEPLFVLQAEISSIYKKNGVVRKVHNLVYMPDFESAEALCRKLAAIGNLNADGRPILGLDSHHLLEMVLETDNRGVLIPAHIWTPWFSLFGSRSGFDSLEECFEDLSHHIFALETGLSSDPDMNRRWSALDRYALISNSDCHSGENLGREANIFSGAPSYDGLFEALRRSAWNVPQRDDCRFLGTVEFFPDEGKYHLDGHRACDIVFRPEETQKHHGLCPVCGKPLTVGVLHRVEALADRKEPVFSPEEPGFHSLIPLPEIVGELLGTGSKSIKVRRKHAELIEHFGSELNILMHTPEADLRALWDDLGEAIMRMRRSEVIRHGGFDGEYGVIRVFTDEEHRELHGGKARKLHSPKRPEDNEPASETRRARRVTGVQQASLLPEGSLSKKPRPKRAATERPPRKDPPKPLVHTQTPRPQEDTTLPEFSAPQLRAIKAGPQPVLVFAGPGAGKTRTLVGRMARLLTRGVAAEKMVAITFTRRAALEVRERLAATLKIPFLPTADTFHALALKQRSDEEPAHILGEEAAKATFASANPATPAATLRDAWSTLTLAREQLAPLTPELVTLHKNYTLWKLARNQVDFTDLLEHWLLDLQHQRLAPPWAEVLVDEIQDLSPLQLALLLALLPKGGTGFFGIGDPDQAIYSFRGAHPDSQSVLAKAWPALERYTLNDSHRSASGILNTANAVLGEQGACGRLHAAKPLESALHLFSAPDARKEANWIADRITGLMGWGSHTQLDQAEDESLHSGPCSPGDIAILVRTRALIAPIRQALDHRGIPCLSPEASPFWADQNCGVLLALAADRFGISLQHSQAVQLLRPLPNPLPSVPESYWQGDPAAIAPLLDSFPTLKGLQDTPSLAALSRAWKNANGWAGLFELVLLGQSQDLLRARAEHIQIMTLHASKGLEFRAVFLPALEEGLLPFFGTEALLHPHGAQPQGASLIAEECRLLYVGVTRAAEAVFASHAARRKLYGHELHLSPSRFIQRFPEQFKKSKLKRHTQKAVRQMSFLD